MVATQKLQIDYADYQKLIAERAWHWAKRTKRDFQELKAEGNLVFCEVVWKFDSSQSSFSTFLWKCLDTRFGNLAKGDWHQPSLEEIPLDLPSKDSSPERMAMVKELIRMLNKDAQTLVECVLETPQDLIWMFGCHGKAVRITRSGLLKYFRKRRGWSIPRYQRATRSIQMALNSL